MRYSTVKVEGFELKLFQEHFIETKFDLSNAFEYYCILTVYF